MAGTQATGTSTSTFESIQIEDLSIDQEIQLIKDEYNSQCKIIKNIGAHIPYIVKVVLSDYDVTIKFQIPDNYPTNRPVVILTWKHISNTDLDDGLRFLMLTQNTVTRMLQAAETWLKEHPELLSKSNEKGPKKRGKNTKKKRIIEEEEVDKKKASMKTASDVISRIQWDSNVQSDLFTVGYIDRFLGIVEKSFCVLSWEDIASVDDREELAIPKHRIEYFKYREFKVWDKKSRTDYVFGSSGEKKMTMFDVIEKYDELVQTPKVENSNEIDSDDDDDFVITTGTGNRINSQPQNSDDDEDRDYWQNKLRPNYFIAVRIRDEGIRSMVEYIQDNLISRQVLYESCCTSLSALHVTICTMRLDTAQQLNTAMNVIRSVENELKTLKTTIRLDGTDTFFSRVLYAKVQHEPQFLEFADTLKLAFRTAGIELLDGHDFVPHMTLMKTSRPVSRQIGREIPKSVYAGSEDVHFGEQITNNLCLCSIEESWGTDGFYTTPLRMDL